MLKSLLSFLSATQTDTFYPAGRTSVMLSTPESSSLNSLTSAYWDQKDIDCPSVTILTIKRLLKHLIKLLVRLLGFFP